MEVTLNFGWLLLVTLLCGACVGAQRRNALRLPLRTALACSLLLALLLLPAISMTDDLQSPGPETVLRVRHLADLLPVSPLMADLWPSLPVLFAMLMLVLLVRLVLLSRLIPYRSVVPPYVLRFRPTAVRPPTPEFSNLCM